MRYSLINPRWSFEGSIYFGCREPHLPLEYGYSRALLERAGHDVQIIDAQLEDLDTPAVYARLQHFRPHFTVVTTAPSYLFWRCAPPELRVPTQLIHALRPVAGTVVCVGPHASTTPRAALEKTAADIAILGECEEILPQLAGPLDHAASIAWRDAGAISITGQPHSTDMSALPALHWPDDIIRRHTHHHHRFDATPTGPGAEMETSRGCPYHCTFCAKDNFRNAFRRRPLDVIDTELAALVSQGVEYVYFIDEIFLAFADVLDVIAAHPVKFGIQTRIDLWTPPMIERLGRAGCVSIEAGVESITESGRDLLDKRCKISTSEIADRLILAKQHVPFVQANLLDSQDDHPDDVQRWRELLHRHGVWANQPVPLFPYPGSPDYTRRWGAPDDHAWERAHAFYLGRFDAFSDIQSPAPSPLVQLEAGHAR